MELDKRSIGIVGKEIGVVVLEGFAVDGGKFVGFDVGNEGMVLVRFIDGVVEIAMP